MEQLHSKHFDVICQIRDSVFKSFVFFDLFCINGPTKKGTETWENTTTSDYKYKEF